MNPAERIALWADRLRDISAQGLQYAQNVYDRDRYRAIQDLMIEMLAYATAQPTETYHPLRTTVFSWPTPVVAGTAAVITDQGKILLMRRSDTHEWVMPGGMTEVGETPAEAVIREAHEETGVRCEALLLVGVYDSRRWDTNTSQHMYKFTFLCRPLNADAPDIPSHQHEALETAWFPETALPNDLYAGHRRRIADAFAAWRGETTAYFDR